ELERHLVGVVLDDRRAGVLADIKHLVERETTADRTLDLALGHLLAVHAERVGVALANAPAVVVEVELAGRELLNGGDAVLLLRLVGERMNDPVVPLDVDAQRVAQLVNGIEGRCRIGPPNVLDAPMPTSSVRYPAPPPTLSPPRT